MAVRLNLGCGAVGRPGYLGLDRFLLAGVGIVADLDAPHLPFADGSVAAVYSSHALEHVQSLVHVMREVWRVCAPGAPVTILAPYHHQGLNLANPYHRQVFNEHTPRFWTADPWGVIDRDEYEHPHAPQWGLSRSDNSDPGFDLRCRRMEFFYFPRYADLAPEEQREARKKYLDVCDQVLYHLLVFKAPLGEADVHGLPIDDYAPPVVAVRRRQRPPASPAQAPSAAAPPASTADRTGVPAEALRGRLRSPFGKALSWLFWKARRRRVLVVFDLRTVSTQIYYENVLAELEAATGRQWLLRHAEEVEPGHLYSYSCVIVQRGISHRMLAILRAARRSGCRTVYDADDNLLRVDQLVADERNPWRQTFGAARPQIAAMLLEADVVKVPSEAASAVYEGAVRAVQVVRPYQRLTAPCGPAPRQAGAPLVVGFQGSAYKDDELAGALPALERLLAAAEAIRVELFGFVPDRLQGHPRVVAHAWTPDYLEFRRRLDGLGWHIGLGPLRDNEFNRCKSNNRYREYAASSIAGIYSDAELFRRTVDDGRTGILVANADVEAWCAAIQRLAADDALRRHIAAAAYEDMRVNYPIAQYVSAMASLVAPRQRLAGRAPTPPR